MTTEPTIKPWLDDDGAPPELRELLSFARSDGATPAQLDKLARRLGPAVGLTAGTLVASTAAGIAPAEPIAASSIMPPAAAVSGKGALAKLLGSTALKLIGAGVAVGAGLWYVSARPAAPASPRTPVVVSAPAPSVAPKAVAPAEIAPAESTPTPAMAPEAAAKPARRKAVVSAAPQVPAEEAPSELELIQRAQDLRGQPAAALSALAEHERAYPKGMLAQEREVLFIEALLAQGRRDQAEARAERLEAAYPGSAHLRRVRVLLGTKAAE